MLLVRESGYLVGVATMHDYSPDRLRRYLKRYHEIAMLADGAHGIRYDGDRIRQSGERDSLRNTHLKRDIDEAMNWLALDGDLDAASLIYSHYIRGMATADISEADGVAQRTIHRRISKGIALMAGYLGWQGASEHERVA